MEPVYVRSSLFANIKEADTKPAVANRTPLATETDSTATSETDGEEMRDSDDTPPGPPAIGVEELYMYGAHAGWNGLWPPMMPHDMASGFYGGYAPGSADCWQYAYGMPQAYPGCEIPSFSPLDSHDGMTMESWSATDQGLPPPPPRSPVLMIAQAAMTEAETPAPLHHARDVRGVPRISRVINVQAVEPPPGLHMPQQGLPPGPSSPSSPDLADQEDLEADMPDVCRGVLAEAGLEAAPTDAPPGLSLPVPSQLKRAVSTPLAGAKEVISPPCPPPMLVRAKSSPAAAAATMTKTVLDAEGGTLRVVWTVDARKLKVKDKVVVSPSFDLQELSLLGTFRMMMYPTQVSERKGGASFRKAKGKGSVHVKCESSLGEVHDKALALRISVHSPQQEDDNAQQDAPPRGLVSHNFADSGICSLPKDQAEWDFGKATDEETQTFVVSLDVLASLEAN